jgi:hypothetical protein
LAGNSQTRVEIATVPQYVHRRCCSFVSDQADERNPSVLFKIQYQSKNATLRGLKVRDFAAKQLIEETATSAFGTNRG